MTQGFGSPHDVAISRDGETMYVVEIGPNRITKFALEWILYDTDKSMFLSIPLYIHSTTSLASIINSPFSNI